MFSLFFFFLTLFSFHLDNWHFSFEISLFVWKVIWGLGIILSHPDSMDNVLSIFSEILNLKVKVLNAFFHFSFLFFWSLFFELSKEEVCNSSDKSGNAPLIIVFPSLVKMMRRHFHWKEKSKYVHKNRRPLCFLN